MTKADRIALAVFALLVALLGVAGLLLLSDGGGGIEPLESRGYIQTTRAYASGWITVSSTAISVTDTAFGWITTTGSADIALAEKAYVSALGAGVLVLWDGNTPTTTLGMPVVMSDTVVIIGGDNVANLRFLQAGGDDATVTVVLEK